ncbi:MAG: FtsX-like permease family protein, partial [bacterium]|nr:FtsX-like permease family protein [bacterium]
ACCLLILMFVNDELSFDNYNEKADRIYRIAGSYRYGGRDMNFATVSAPMGKTLVNDCPEVEDAVRFRSFGSDAVIKYEDNSFTEKGLTYSDPSFFNVFTVPLLEGNPKTALKEPNTLVLSKKTAEKYFGKQNPVGKTVTLNNKDDYKVTGVFSGIPRNSHFHFDFIASLASLEESRDPTWLKDNFNTYILLKPNTDPKVLEAKFPGLIKKYMAPEFEKIAGRSIDKEIASGEIKISFYLQPLRDIHLNSDLEAELEANSDIKYVYIFSAIALFILLIAAINFMNLSTARSAGRAKEVGIRKVLGSSRRGLMGQFLVESLILSFLSMIFALSLVNLVLPFFNGLSGKELTMGDNYSGTMLLAMFAITLLTGVLAGFYPAFFISAFQPISVLKGKLKSGVKGGFLRSLLVVFQFAASIVLIIGTLVVMNQLDYIQNKKLGFDKERVLILHNTGLLDKQAQTFKNEMLKSPQIKNAAVSSYLPVPSERYGTAVFPEGRRDNERSTSMQTWGVDYDYIKTLGMKIAAGRDFSRDFSTDTAAMIINQRAARQFGWDNPLGKRLDRVNGDTNETESYTVIGVVEDFHFESLRDTVTPLLMYLGKHNRDFQSISFRIGPGNIAEIIDLLRDKWKQFLPGQPFDYSFLDESFNRVYDAEQRLGKIFAVFALLAIFVGCLGLFGLAAFTAEQRTTEIGIRKVLGASISSIVRLLSTEFVVLVAVANIIAWPVAYFIMKQWLLEFAYRAPLSIWTFPAAGLAALAIALLTIGYQSVKAAAANPVKSIKYE